MHDTELTIPNDDSNYRCRLLETSSYNTFRISSFSYLTVSTWSLRRVRSFRIPRMGSWTAFEAVGHLGSQRAECQVSSTAPPESKSRRPEETNAHRLEVSD